MSTKKIMLDLADNNKKRWSQFTSDMPCTFDRFCKRLVDLKITRNPDDAATIWGLFNPKGDEIQFREFIQFLQNDKLGNEPIAVKKTSVMSSLYELRRSLIDYCLSIDRSVSGTISQAQLSDFALSNHIISHPNELAILVSQVDKKNTGKLNYFKLLYKLSQMGAGDFPLPELPDEEAGFAVQAHRPTKTPGARSSLDPSIFGGESSQNGAYVPETNARKGLDPTIFGEKSPQRGETHNGGRTHLDPSIFGEKPEAQQVQAAPAAKIDLANARDCTDFNAEQTISLIARIANSKFRSLRDCFGNWRGGSDRLSWEDIYRGMVNDAKIEVSPEIVEALVSEYGGELTVSSFTRFVSDGARINAPEPVKEAPPPLTERDILLNKIAAGLKGKDWEAAIKFSKNALDLSRNLKKVGVTMKSDELRGAFEELGMKKIVMEIKQRQTATNKKRICKA